MSMSTDRRWTILCVRLINKTEIRQKCWLTVFSTTFSVDVWSSHLGFWEWGWWGRWTRKFQLPSSNRRTKIGLYVDILTHLPLDDCFISLWRTLPQHFLWAVCSYLFGATCNLTQDTHTSSLLFLSSVAAVETLPVLQISHAQQECGQLFPAQQRRIPPSLSPHHRTSTPTISSPLLRIPLGLWALSLPIPVCQSQPFIVITLTLCQSQTVHDLQNPAKVSGPASQDPLFPGACLP